jgi:hypothetical protein
MKTLILNLYGGPGTGKSTTAAGVFHQLKLLGVNCEMASEWAKEKVWAGEEVTLNNQLYVFGKQYHRIWRLLGKVDIVVTDSPLLLSVLYYKDENPYFTEMVAFEYSRLNNLDVLLGRVKKYNPAGRLQSEEKAKHLDVAIKEILDSINPTYINIPADASAVQEITHQALHRIADMAT